jgi:hypothetical protein
VILVDGLDVVRDDVVNIDAAISSRSIDTGDWSMTAWTAVVLDSASASMSEIHSASEVGAEPSAC